jgi:hypothetical protein
MISDDTRRKKIKREKGKERKEEVSFPKKLNE